MYALWEEVPKLVYYRLICKPVVQRISISMWLMVVRSYSIEMNYSVNLSLMSFTGMVYLGYLIFWLFYKIATFVNYDSMCPGKFWGDLCII